LLDNDNDETGDTCETRVVPASLSVPCPLVETRSALSLLLCLAPECVPFRWCRIGAKKAPRRMRVEGLAFFSDFLESASERIERRRKKEVILFDLDLSLFFLFAFSLVYRESARYRK